VEYLKKVAGRAVKRAARAGARKLLIVLLPYLAPFIPFLVFLFLIAVLVAATYSAMAPGSYLTGVNPSPEDKEIQQKYEQLCNKYNIADTWLVNPGKPSRPRLGNPNYESSPDNPFYPNRGRGANIGAMVDRYRQDFKLRLTWGQVHGACLFRNYVTGEQEITDEQREKTAKDLHPYFYYKESEVIVCGKDGCKPHTVYLLVEAYTVQGHYQYHYEWVTETHGKGENAYTVTYERLRDVQQILPDKWQRLKDWMKQEYNLENNADELELARTWLWEATRGFDRQTEWLNWLVNNVSYSSIASSAMIPPELVPFFKEAEEKYGIPWWFLAAMAFKESSFNPGAENPDTHCYGLMQVSPSNWEHYAPLLGFDPVMDRDNPRAQVMVGAYLLKNYLGNVDWEGDWKEQTLPGLVRYGGFVEVPPGKPYGSVEEWCRVEYASIIWELAESFRDVSGTWPVPGYQSISSYFGWRIRFTGEKQFHKGIDIPAPEGTPVVSVSGGVVTFVGWENPNDPGQGYGLYVTVLDGQHLYLYAHLSRTDVVKGQTVQPGQQIGAVGNTGSSTGPHLHFGVQDLGGGNWIDPLLVVQPQ
jgi:hypothetical protein